MIRWGGLCSFVDTWRETKAKGECDVGWCICVNVCLEYDDHHHTQGKHLQWCLLHLALLSPLFSTLIFFPSVSLSLSPSTSHLLSVFFASSIHQSCVTKTVWSGAKTNKSYPPMLSLRLLAFVIQTPQMVFVSEETLSHRKDFTFFTPCKEQHNKCTGTETIVSGDIISCTANSQTVPHCNTVTVLP